MGTGSVLQKLIDARGISVRELSKRLTAAHGGKGFSPATIGRWLNGSGDPRLSELLAVAEFFDVPLVTLVDGEETEGALTEDERAVLKLYRALEIDESEALRRLSGEGRSNRPAKTPDLPKTFTHGRASVPGSPSSKGKGVS